MANTLTVEQVGKKLKRVDKNLYNFIDEVLVTTLAELDKKKIHPSKSDLSDIIRYNMCVALDLEAHAVVRVPELDSLTQLYKYLKNKHFPNLPECKRADLVNMVVASCLVMLEEVRKNVVVV